MPRPQRGVPEKSKDFKGSIKRLFKSLDNWRYLVIISLILACLSAILALIAPNKLSNLTDTITLGLQPNISEEIINDIVNNPEISGEDKQLFTELITDTKDSKNIDMNNILKRVDDLPESIYSVIKPKMNMAKVKSIAILLGILYIVSSLFSYIESLLMTIISNKFAKKLRSNVSEKINRLPLKYFDTHETGDILSRITNDIDTVAQNMNNSLSTLVTSLTLFLGSVLMMFITNWIMSITAIVASLIGFSLMGVILGKSQKYFTMRQEELGNLNGYIEEIYSGHNVVKAYNGEIEANEQFDKLNKKLYECNRKSQFLSGIMQPIMMFVGNLGYVAVCVVGALLTMNNVISFGVIVAFMIYVRMFTNPLSQIAQAMTSLQSTAAASERVFDFLDEEEMTNESKLKGNLNKDKVKGEIEFKHVKFGYDDTRTIIKDFSVKVKPGQKIAIVGPTGAGKTTMVNLLMKFYEIKDGEIIIDGVSTKDLTRENIHDLFVMVLQDTWLFDGTIRENLKFNKENVTDKEIKEACTVVGVDHFIKTLPGGLDARVGNNESISQGQKQLLTIARGMIENAPFLILDEATSNVDTRTEELVQKAMDKLTKGRTSFIIAHRLSTIKNADLILVMNEGNIVEQGTHNELLKKNGFYAELYNSQFDTIVE
jgi:ATP-binding cassette subfamily B protein